MTAVNIPVVVFTGKLPSNGIFRLNGMYVFDFEKYYPTVLPQIAPPDLPPSVEETATIPASTGFHYVHFIAEKWYIILFKVNSLRERFLWIVQ